MKSKEEIEQLAKEVHYDSAQQGLDANGCFNQYQGFIKGYSKCQEDMADKKYTKKDMIDFAFDTYCYISGIMKVPFNKVSENGTHAEENFKEYIKNKQD